MAGDQRILKQDGYLNIATESCNITYHPNLNVILVFNSKNEVKVLDVHSGVILQASTLPGNSKNVCGRFMPMQEKILFWNGQNLGLRGDYNGVLLLDTILQAPIVQNDDVVRLELLLSEAVIFLNSLHNLVENGLECQTDVSNELLEKIRDAQANTKKGIKAHKWNTICLELPYSSLKYVSSNVVEQLKRLDRHIPALAIASAINERLTDLLFGSRIVDKNNYQRCQMFSEAARRQTFEKWPHMDYKWALPDQMAQAGFYHQPSISGEDRALCFTCNVCLVCWEKTDEPWSEHERHSPNCPFVKGEYTQNVPLAVTYASDPAVKTSGIDVISNSDYSHVLCTSSSKTGDVTVWSIERQLKKIHTFNIGDVVKNIYPEGYDSVEVTAICVLTNHSKHKNHHNLLNKKVKVTFKDNIIGSKIILGLSVIKDNKINLKLLVLNIFIKDIKLDDCANTLNNNETIVCEREEEKLFLKKLDENFDNSFMGGLINIKFNDSEKTNDFNNPCTMVNYDFLKDDLSNLHEPNESESLLATAKQSEETSDGNEKVNILQNNYACYEEIDCSVQSFVSITSEGFKIDEILPTSSACTQIIVKLLKLDNKKLIKPEEEESTIGAKILLYPCDDSGDITNECQASTTFSILKIPKEICVLPTSEKNDRKIDGVDFEGGAFCIVTKDGAIQLLSLQSFELITCIEVPNEKFVSVVYCKTLDRICGCTKNGSLIFYSLHDVDNESEDEIVDEGLLTSDNSITGTEQEVTETDGLNKQNFVAGSSSTNTSTGSDPQLLILLAHKSDLTLTDLKSLYSLTLFDEMLTPYAAEVPSCWNELVQAQKQRRHPQHLRPGEDTHLTKTWRLHNDATTWDEHVIELNLAKTPSLGHIDLKFSLYQQCPNPPAIQVTLLKQNTSGFGYRMKGPSSVNFGSIESVVDETIWREFPLGQNYGVTENPVLTEEYLQAQNADILAGPIELSSCMDLCDQGGVVALTSPKLFKTRARNFLLHIKTMVDPAKEGQSKTRVPVKKKGVMRFLISSLAHSTSHNSANTTSFSKNSSSTKQTRNNFYIGCDWLHEISITIRSTKKNIRVTNERAQRIAMLESNSFIENLLAIICNSESSAIKKNLALDILTWTCTIRLNRFRSPKMERVKNRSSNDNIKPPTASNNVNDSASIDMLDQQKECVKIVENYLENVISNCIINGDRTLAHKCVKHILLLIEGVRNLPIDIQKKLTFDDSLKEAITNCIPELPLSKHSSAVRWFTLLVCSTSTNESHSKISEICIKKLMDITKEMDKRWDPFCSLLGTRFGLYGFPFEPELFDMDLPSMNKNNTSSPNSLVNIIRSSTGLSQTFGLDLKKLSSIDGVDFRSFPHLIKSKGISNQLRGLLEVEPLHFTCFSASEATRIENVDSITSSSSSNINMDDIIVTPMQNTWGGQTDGKKDSEKDNFQDDEMNNVKNMLADGQIELVSKNNGKKHKIKDDMFEAELDNVIKQMYEIASPLEDKVYVKCPKYPKFKTICQYIECCDENSNTSNEYSDEHITNNKAIQKHLNGHKNEDNTNVFPWHKHLTAPPKQMVVVERIHSGARRFIVLDFGTPILLTDLVIPSCDELASIFIDVWCFEEEADSVRLVETQDIGQKTLVLSDLQPPPICRYMKITIIGRYGMSTTRCKIPIGNFYGHIVVLDNDGYGDPLLQYMKHPPANVQAQIKSLNCLYEDVHCRYSLSSSKLMELLIPVLNCEMSNVAHMQAFIYKQRDDDFAIDHNKIITTYEECIMLQHQINIIKNVLNRLETSISPQSTKIPKNILQISSRDKLRVLSQNLVEILLHFSIEYGLKNIFALHMHFNIDVANTLFNSLVVSGDAQIQLSTCSLLVRMCCFQPWWGDFLADIFCNLFSSQNSKIFPQDRIFYLLTYLGRRSIAMGTCRTIVIDAILKTLAKLLAPISPHYQDGEDLAQPERSQTTGLCLKSDLQLITWLLLFLSVCLDDSNDKKNKSSNRWDFMSCEADFTKSRSHSNNSTVKQMRCLKKRILQQSKYNCSPQYNDLTKKFYIMQNELPEIFMELTGKQKPKSNKSSTNSKSTKEHSPEVENNFDKGLKSIKVSKLLIVIRGLVSLLLEMDFTCNMDLFLLTCKVIARLVSVCKPYVQIYKIITTTQLEQLIRLAVWNDQQQPWAVHAITCLLQDLLNKNIEDPFEVESTSSEVRLGLDPQEIVLLESASGVIVPPTQTSLNGLLSSQLSDAKYSQLPSLIECEDNEIDDFFSEMDIVDRGKNLAKKDSLSQNKNSFNYFCKSVSNGMDARLEFGLDTNVEITIRKLIMISSMDLYASLPQISTAEVINGKAELENWPQYIMNIWSGPEYNNAQHAYQMLKNVFDNILSDLQLPDTWVHLEQVLQIWLTLNSELSKSPYNLGITSKNVPKIQFGTEAVKGLILALTWHGNIKLHSWCLGFQCLILACNSAVSNDNHETVTEIIVKDDYFEKMMLRFFSGYGMCSSMITNRCAGPTICKYLHELLSRLQQIKSIDLKKKLKHTLLNVILQLVQPSGAISNQQGPIDAQSQLVGDLLQLQYDKADVNVSLNIIESISYLAYNNISNVDKVQCQRSSDVNNSSKAFGSLFATVLGADNSKQNTSVSDNSLIISLLNLSSSLIQTELFKCDIPPTSKTEMPNESQTDETKAEQLIFDNNKTKVSCVADTVLQHLETMKRLLGSLSNCSSSSFTLMAQTSLYSMKPTESTFFLNEPETIADAVFNLLMLLSEKATNPNLVVAPIYQYLENGSSSRNALPRLQLSEPFLWYILKVLEIPEAVNIFTNMGGIQILCKNLVTSNKVLVNMQPGLISMIMQHMTKNSKLKSHTYMNSTGSSKKSCQNQKIQDGMINFAPFCSITSENSTAQSSDVLIQTPIASHRRARTPAWSYMFYPNESHVDLTITLPTAILLKEIQLQPHLQTLSSCPSAVAIEISRDYGLGPISFGQPLTTTGMTCIRLKLSKPEIATSIVLRLYRPKDSASIGLTQIAVLGNTIFSVNRLYGNEMLVDDDTLAKTSVGWIRILSRCFTVATIIPECKLSKAVIGAASEYPGFLEACCSLMNVVPLVPQACLQNLETVLLKLGAYNRELCVSLIKNLLWGTTPQTYRLSNEAICDLLFELCTTNDSYVYEKVVVLLEWILGLQKNFSNRITRCTNPQSGFVKCIASILWTIYTEICNTKLPDLISEVFETCLYWIDVLENDDPLKISFDSLLCSLCCIKPGLFNELLKKADVSLMRSEESEMNFVQEETKGITDDNKEASGSEWFKNVAAQNLSTLLVKPSLLATLAMACQSPLAIYQLVDSGLPKLLAHALFEYCCSMSPEIHKMSLKSQNSQSNNYCSNSNCLTDADKAENYRSDDNLNNDSLININHVPKILDFFSECCSEGHMRDWLGSYQGSIFWKPLLELLCNYRPIVISDDEPVQQCFISMERSTINFFSRVTSCHPKNQDFLTIILISVIKKPQITPISKKSIISGFTRRIVLQLLLENERILVSVRSKMPLLKKESCINLVNNHPSKRVNSRHLLFYVGSHTKCQDILQNCISVYSNIFPSMHSESQQSDSSGSIQSSCGNQCEGKPDDSAFQAKLDFYGSQGMEYLSVAAGVTAKDKRLKDVKNQAAVFLELKDFIPKFSKMFNRDDILSSSNASSINTSAQLIHPDIPEVVLTSDTTISQILATLHSKKLSLSTPCITLHLLHHGKNNDEFDETLIKAVNMEPLPSPLQRFSSRGGLSLLAHYLPIVYPDNTKAVPNNNNEKEKPSPSNEWIKVEQNDEIYEDLEDAIEPTLKNQPITSVPPHSLAAFGLFLRLPAYSDVLLRDKLRAQCLLRLVLGVTGDGEGNDIYSLALAPSLPTLPFEVFRQLLDSSLLTTDDGMLLRRMVIEVGAIHLVLNCLGIFTHQSQNGMMPDLVNNTKLPPSSPSASTTSPVINSPLPTNNNINATNVPTEQISSDDKSHMYWAKGTGFGTGSTQQSWNVEQALLRQKSEEEHVTVLLQVLSSYINPDDKIPSNLVCDDIMSYHETSDVNGELPPLFLDLLQKSCLIPALCSYLRNDSVLDITRHIPLYRAILQLLRAISLSYQLVSLLQPQDNNDRSPSISELLAKMKTCVDTYAKRLRVNKKSNIKGQTQKVTVNIDDGDDEGLALLIPDIHETSILVQKSTNNDNRNNPHREQDGCSPFNIPLSKSIEQRYLEVMKTLQFDSYDMIVEAENGYRFAISHHFENNVRLAGDRYHPSRVKRLAQETVTLSTSLPLSYSSSVFVRCDTDRLDVMKVLITGPADTPYANGCFEFDVFFPPDYPNSPMLINLETTGRHSVRFNPNLYNDGKVCLSVLNTWHGRPEEKWNAQASSFLQVLVSIQSLILVPEPYFNEPGFERSRGTPPGTYSSREYNSNIYQSCVRWAMLEQIRKPNPCFKDVIHTHFWLKRNEICSQIESWIEELSKPQYNERSGRTISFNSMVLRRQYRQLREELAKLKVPEGLEDLDMPFNPNVTLSVMTETVTTTPAQSGSTTSFTFSSTTSNDSSTPTSAAQPSQPLLENPDDSESDVDPLENSDLNPDTSSEIVNVAIMEDTSSSINFNDIE